MAELTEVHDMVSADRTVVDDDVPSPQGHGIPLSPSSAPSISTRLLVWRPHPTFLTSKRFLSSDAPPSVAAAFKGFGGLFVVAGAVELDGASVMSTSAMAVPDGGRLGSLKNICGGGRIIGTGRESKMKRFYCI